MKTALISVYDKRGIVNFAKKLVGLDWRIISTGGTYDLLKKEGLDVVKVEDLTNFKEILGGRVKTLHPNIHGGILYKREDEDHINTLKENNIDSIDMVVNNLYPFEETVKKEGISQEEIIENIDIGGPSMIRAGAKNFRDVIVVIDPSDYGGIVKDLEEGEVSLEKKRYLAGKVFSYTAYYDGLISRYFNEVNNIEYPEILNLSYKKEQSLRYGENPQQKASFYREVDETKGSLADSYQIHGKELSFNNINDANGALELLKEFKRPTVVAVKHSNPCGVGSGDSLEEAYTKAYECDSESIFGGIIAVNREVDRKVAKRINDIFIEIVIAPGYSDEAIEILKRKKNIRLLVIEDLDKTDYREKEMKKVLGGLLIQDRNDILLEEGLEVVTKRRPRDEELDDLLFAWKVGKHVNSNGIVVARNEGTTGLGLGEVNRFWAVNKAIERTGDNIEGAVLASDGFFPFKDSIERIAKAGIKAIIQPGGSIKDGEVIEEANKHNIAMVFTKTRHFKH